MEVCREIDQNADKNINVNMTLEESLMTDSQENIASNQQAALYEKNDQNINNMTLDEGLMNNSQENIALNQQAALDEKENASLVSENYDYIEFKQRIDDQLFIIK